MPDRGWEPTSFERYEEGFDTSMETAKIVTDAGPAYIKAMGNRQGPHCLASECVATLLAAWFGLKTFDIALMMVNADIDEIPFVRGGFAATGPALVSRSELGHTWGGDAESLDSLVNPNDITRMVVFDTWIRNCDRHPPSLATRRPNYDNVFLRDLKDADAGKTELIAMDHTHAFNCGRDLNADLIHIDIVNDDRLYGLFPEFVGLIREEATEQSIVRLREFRQEVISPLVDAIPTAWDVDATARSALIEMVSRRANYVADTIHEKLKEQCWPEKLFDTRANEGEEQ